MTKSEAGSLGGKATAKRRTKKERSEAARHAARERWDQVAFHGNWTTHCFEGRTAHESCNLCCRCLAKRKDAR